MVCLLEWFEVELCLYDGIFLIIEVILLGLLLVCWLFVVLLV